jgi:hypothetical protein
LEFPPKNIHFSRIFHPKNTIQNSGHHDISWGVRRGDGAGGANLSQRKERARDGPKPSRVCGETGEFPSGDVEKDEFFLTCLTNKIWKINIFKQQNMEHERK